MHFFDEGYTDDDCLPVTLGVQGEGDTWVQSASIQAKEGGQLRLSH